ncbi:MAG: hypothetical protein MUE51_13565, partial [Thermoleophilia bacterium]|nr:hypothetical protein [Thermoleophilia bacterium]
MRRSLGILIAAALLTPVGSAVAAPTLSHPAVFPEGWINLDTAGGSWVQSDVPSGFSASSEVQINTAPDESPSGEWLTRWSTSGFLHA